MKSLLYVVALLASLSVLAAQENTSETSQPEIGDEIEYEFGKASIGEPKVLKVDIEDPSPFKMQDVLYPNPIAEEEKDRFNLTYYEPMYFIFGNPTSKVNFSFKYQALRSIPLYLGYVQNIFWLLKEESKPFKDANFNPRVFYRYSFDDNDEQDYLDAIVYEHKSNGKSEPESRSFDSMGAKINWRFEYENWTMRSHLKALWRYNLDRTNKDFEEYVGPFELGLVLSQFSYDWLDKAELSYRMYTGGEWGQDFNKMSHEVGIAFRVFGRELTPAFYIQYFNGYF